MTLFLVAIGLVVLFGAAGLAVVPRTASGPRSDLGGPPSPDALYLAPALGGLALAVASWVDVSLFNGLTALTWTVAGVLVTTGLVRAWRCRLLPGPRACAAGVALALGLVAFVGFPFRNHIAAPGVDSQYYAFITWLIAGDGGFPRARFWPSLDVVQLYVGTAGNESLAAAVMRVTGTDASLAQLHLAVAWVTAAMLCAWVIVRRIAPDLPRAVALPCLFLAFNSAFIWQYGDGSFARIPGTTGLLLLAALVSIQRDLPRALGTIGFPLLLGAVLGALLAVHPRLFIWGTVILGLYMLAETWRFRREPGIWRLWVIPVAAAATLLLVLVATLLDPGPLLARLEGGESAAIHAVRDFPAADLLRDFLRFQGWLAHLVVAAGALVALRASRRERPPSLVIFAAAAWLGVAVFLVDPLVQSVAPFTRSLIFPSMVTLADFSVPKLVFGTILVGALWRRLQRAPGHAVRRLATGCLAVLAVVAALAALGLLPIVNLQNPTLIRLSFGFFLADLPGPFGTEYVYAAALLVAAGALCTAALKGSAPPAATLLCAGIATAFGAHEVVNGRFNRAELSPSQRAAYEWIGRSGDPAETLVLTSSQRDIAVEDEVANVAGVAPDGRPYDWSLPWLPVISDRGAVFNRGNYVARFTGSMPLVAGEPPPLAALDRAYWHPADPESLALMRAWGVTHIYVPDRHQPILADALARAAGVTRVFATPSDDWPTRENVVYRVEPAS